MSAAHRAGALAKMKEHHEEAVRLRESGDAAGSRRAAAAATHAADVVRSLDSGTIVGTASSVDFSPSSSVSGGTAGTSTSSSTSTAAATPGAWTGSETAPDVRGGYNPGEGVDMTNTNPAYWASAVRYFTAHPRGNPTTGELGIWIPNLEKEGNERVALAAIAGGVTAHVGSNYSNNTIDNAYAQKLHRDRGDTVGAEGTYNTGGAEKVIRLAGTHRGGVLTDTGYDMGSTAPSEHGVHIKGGVVVKGAGTDYVAGGGDFGGLLSRGDTITGDWLTGILGGMDKDGMRLGGTYAPVRGATGSGVAAGGTATGMGTFYGGGSDPLASMPKVADYTAYMDPNSIFGGLSENAAVRSGLLYNPEKSNYGEEMAAAGMPAFSPGLLSGGSGVGSVTYGSPASGFMKPKTGAAAGGGGAVGIPIGSTTTAPGRAYAFPTDRPLYGGGMSKDIPTFASLGALSSMYPDLGSYGAKYPGAKGTAKIGGTLYAFGGGGESGADGWSPTGFSYPLVTSPT